MATVQKDFTTRLRRFFAGEPISQSENLDPHTFDALVESGHIERLPAKQVDDRPKKRVRASGRS